MSCYRVEELLEVSFLVATVLVKQTKASSQVRAQFGDARHAGVH